MITGGVITVCRPSVSFGISLRLEPFHINLAVGLSLPSCIMSEPL